jgi:transposase
LWGAGRVEDTYNLLGHALHQALRVIACQQGRGLAATAADIGLTLAVDRSLKAALDLDWDAPDASRVALRTVLDNLMQLEHYLTQQPEQGRAASDVAAPLMVAAQVQTQDLCTVDGQVSLRQGVAKDRRISLTDGQMRHGRKSRRQLVDGYKRHVLHDLDTGLVRAVGLTAANAPEATVTEALEADVAAQRIVLTELHIDRAYLSSHWVTNRPVERTIYCKAWPVRHGPRFHKTAFTLDWDAQHIRCPAGAELPFTPGGLVVFPTAQCQTCPLREQCTTSKGGRSVRIHPDERLLQELRERQQTPAGRAKLRERVAVEHDLAHIGHWQGDRARYWGVRKNLFDLRRVAVVHNLHILMRPPMGVAQAA